MNRDLERAQKRGAQYWYDDGLTEIAVACLFAAIASLFAVEALAPRGSLPRNSSALGLVVLVAGGMWAINRAVRAAKARITYPRTGYVRYRQPARTLPRRLLVMALGAMVSFLLVVLIRATAPASLDWMLALQGLSVALFLLFMGYKVAVPRLYLLAVASLLIGGAVSLAGLDETWGNSVYFATMGLLFLVSGTTVLRTYLRSTRLPEGE